MPLSGKWDVSIRTCRSHWRKVETPRRPKPSSRRWLGPSGFMLFGKTDHGSLLRIVGQERKAIQYVLGNPLFALQMTRHDIRASRYAPLRVLLYQNEEGKTCVESLDRI